MSHYAPALRPWTGICSANHMDIDNMADCIMGYIMFSMNVAAPNRTVHCFPDSRPWITSDLKELLDMKKRPFTSGKEMN